MHAASGHAFAHGQPMPASTLMCAASEAQANDALRDARGIFHRTLASWASDVLILQHRGLHQATWNTSADARRLRRAA